MSNMLESHLLTAADVIEKGLDCELHRLTNLDTDDLKAIRANRIREMQMYNSKKQEWLKNDHGTYAELADEKEFFEVSRKSPNIVCHFYRESTERCRIVDMHLGLLAAKHVETRFCKINAEKSPFLTQRLKIKIMPTIVLVKDSKTEDFIFGFSDLGNCDDFSTEMLEKRIARSGVIEFKQEYSSTSEKKSKPFINRTYKTIRSGDNSNESDFED